MARVGVPKRGWRRPKIEWGMTPSRPMANMRREAPACPVRAQETPETTSTAVRMRNMTSPRLAGQTQSLPPEPGNPGEALAWAVGLLTYRRRKRN